MRLLEREEPLTVLHGVVRSAAGGRGRVALVTGEAGIGKTALVAALAARSGGARVLTGWCEHLSTPRPLGPLADVARTLGGPLREALAGSPAQVHDALLAELAGPAPTVLVLEDVHWADDATVDVVRTLGRRIVTLPAALVLTYRDGEVDGAAPLRTALAALPPAVTRLPLAPLSAAAVADLVPAEAGRAAGGPAGLTDRQAEVLRLLAEGLTNAEIADRLVVSPRTAEHHVTAVLGRLGVGGRREAVRRAGELGLLSSWRWWRPRRRSTATAGWCRPARRP